MNNVIYENLRPEHDAALAALIRRSLEANGLDIPGTAYFDEALDHLSSFYDRPGRSYQVLLKQGMLVGGVGIAEFDGFEGCCELQKLYLTDSEKGHGSGYEMVRRIEERARAMGYKRIYLETHSNLRAAIHIYEKSGYRQIERPGCVVHSTMDRFYIKDL